MELSLEHRVLAVAGVIVGYCVCLAVYRLYLSPLSKFPGSKLAIVTLWFEFYYDVIKRGRYQWKIAEMHETYGWYTMEMWCHRPSNAYFMYKGPSYESIRSSYTSTIPTFMTSCTLTHR